MADLTIKTTYNVFENLNVDYNKKLDKALRILFNKGLISYANYVGTLTEGFAKNA